MQHFSALFIIEPAKVPQGSLPVLFGGHMRPGPTAEPNLNPQPRYCDAPCPQTCAPACYDWCCYPSVAAPTPPMQIMMMPVTNAPQPAMPPTPGPLQYPMNYLGPGDACSPLPCAAKKTEVTNTTAPVENKNVNDTVKMSQNGASSTEAGLQNISSMNNATVTDNNRKGNENQIVENVTNSTQKGVPAKAFASLPQKKHEIKNHHTSKKAKKSKV